MAKSASSVITERHCTFSATRLPSFNAPPTKPPTSLISSCFDLANDLYSATVSPVLLVFDNLKRSVDHDNCLFFHFFDFLLLATAIDTSPSYFNLDKLSMFKAVFCIINSRPYTASLCGKICFSGLNISLQLS